MLEQIPAVNCYKYQSQKVEGLPFEPWATFAYHSYLFIANERHEIEIRDSSCPEKVICHFPTVDRVLQMQYCPKGNYICTLEKKKRNSKSAKFIRVYTNWNMTGNNTTMRARIACKVSPSYQAHTDVLEMIEIQLKERPVCFSCCHSTGNILILFGKTASLHLYITSVLDISKQSYIDFKEFLNVEISFVADKVKIVEDILSFVSLSELHVIKVVVDSGEQVEENLNKVDSVNYAKSCDRKNSVVAVKNEILQGVESTQIRKAGDKLKLDWFELIQNTTTSNELNEVTIVSLPFEQAQHDFEEVSHESIEILGPRYNTKEVDISVDCKVQLEGKWVTKVLTMVFKRFEYDGHEKNDAVKCFEMVPQYASRLTTKHGLNDHSKKPLRSDNYHNLSAVECFVSLETEGFLYNLWDSPTVLALHLYFTSPVHQVFIGDSTLHAITDAGLETYVLFHSTGSHNIPPPESKVWLASLTPFMNIEKACLSKEALHLFSYSGEDCPQIDDPSWTLYTLELPGINSLCSDMMELANTSESPELAHDILLASVFLATSRMISNQWHCLVLPSSEQTSDHPEEYISVEKLRGDLLHQLATSCLRSERDMLLVPQYLRESRLTVAEIVKLLSDEIKSHPCPPSPYLTFICKEYVLGILANSDELDSKTSSLIVEIWAKYFPEDVSHLVTQNRSKLTKQNNSRLPRGDIILETLKTRIKAQVATPQDSLALLLLFCERNALEQCGTVVKSLPAATLTSLLVDQPELLFTPGKHNFPEFSQLSQVLRNQQPLCLVQALASYSNQNQANFSTVLSLFVRETCDPSHMIPAKEVYSVFIDFLEAFYQRLVQGTEAMMDNYNQGKEYLLRHYLSQQLKQPDPTTATTIQIVGNKTLYGKRKSYLDLMEPFNTGTNICILFSGQKKESQICGCCYCNHNLLKLQSFMCSPLYGDKERAVVDEFLSLHPNITGYLSLSTLCLPLDCSLNLVLHNCASVFLPMAKEFLTDLDQWLRVVEDIKTKLDSIKPSSKFYEDYLTLEQNVVRHVTQVCDSDQVLQIMTSMGMVDKYDYMLKESMDRASARKLRDRIMRDHKDVHFVTLSH